MAVCQLIPFKYLLYTILLSDVLPQEDEEDDTIYGVFRFSVEELYEKYPDYDAADIQDALTLLGEEGLLLFEGGTIFVGEYRGKRFFTFEMKSCMGEDAVKRIYEAVTSYRKHKSAIAKSRAMFLKEQLDKLFVGGIDKLKASDFTELHGILYELYTGGETYKIRNQVEYYQMGNILKAYDRGTTLAVLVEAVLGYDKFRSKGVPTLVNVGFMKDDVFKSLSKSPDSGSKEYMREGSVTDSSF